MTVQVEVFRIDSIGKGCLAVMAHPASAAGADSVANTIAEIAALGFHQVVSLLEPAEAEVLGLAQEAELVTAQSMKFVSFAIPDMGLPACSDDFVRLAQHLFTQIDAGTNTLIHCRGGIGRSGLLAAAVLLRGGKDVREAFAQVSLMRGRQVPETAQQGDWLQASHEAIMNEVEQVTTRISR
jgi:protein-tyrosine phosphatase